MEDILKALVNSRQQGTAGQSADPMGGLVGGLLQGAGNVNLSDGVDAGDVMGMLGGLMGGAQQPPASQPQASGLGGMMGALEGIVGGQGAGQNDPLMMILQPYVAPLAKKANIPENIAMIVVSFVAHQLLSHHPSSGRNSNHFDLEDLLTQVNSGKVDSGLLQNSGMVKQLSQKTGLDESTAEKALQTGFSMIAKEAAGMMAK